MRHSASVFRESDWDDYASRAEKRGKPVGGSLPSSSSGAEPTPDQ